MRNILRSPSTWKAFGFCLLILAAGLAFTGCRDSTAPPASPPQTQQTQETNNAQAPDGENNLQRGQALFDRMCATCHGTRGSGRGTRPGPALRHDDYVYGTSFEAVKKSIRDGRPNGMPFFHHVLSDEELEAVTHYVLSLIP